MLCAQTYDIEKEWNPKFHFLMPFGQLFENDLFKFLVLP